MTDQHRATPEQWAHLLPFASDTRACVLELRGRIEALEAAQQPQPVPAPEKPPLGCKPRWLMDEERLHDLEAATKRYEEDGRSVPSEWRAEIREIVVRQKQRIESAPTTAEVRPAGSFVEQVAARVNYGIDAQQEPEGIARAAIREVAAWLRTGWILHAAELLEQEADR